MKLESKVLRELLKDKDLKMYKLAKDLGLTDVTYLYSWRKGGAFPRIENLIKLAKYFNLSLEYLLARTEDLGQYAEKSVNNFYNRLREIMTNKKISIYKMINKDKICASTHFTKWKRGSVPSPETLIKLADYLDVSVDELLGC